MPCDGGWREDFVDPMEHCSGEFGDLLDGGIISDANEVINKHHCAAGPVFVLCDVNKFAGACGVRIDVVEGRY